MTTSTHAESATPTPVPERTALAHRASGGDRAFSLSAHTVLIIWSTIVIVPLLWTLMTSFKTTSEIFASPACVTATSTFLG